MSTGDVVTLRSREWIVTGLNSGLTATLRPTYGLDRTEITILLDLEGDDLQSASANQSSYFNVGDPRLARIIYDAERFSVRSPATPFRSLGGLTFSPRPYQLVTTAMAIKQSPTRMLIADDVGVGKTIEAGLVMKELVERGEVRRYAVLCPSHLCDQWEVELRTKFGLTPKVLRPATFTELDRAIPRDDMNVFEYYPQIVASIDYLKTERMAPIFIRSAPELIVVDEAHSAGRPDGSGKTSEQQRYQLLSGLASTTERHLVLVTATPHNGVESHFRSILGLLNEDFDQNESERPRGERQRIARHVIQRTRRELTDWSGTKTDFPDVKAEERPYEMSGEYLAFQQRLTDYCRTDLLVGSGVRRRVNHWATLALLRCALSSPAAAISVLRAKRDRINSVDSSSTLQESEIDSVYGQMTLDPVDQEGFYDGTPTQPVVDSVSLGTDTGETTLPELEMEAKKLLGEKRDAKLAAVIDIVREQLREGLSPIVFCRFIPTAEYVAEQIYLLLNGEIAGLAVEGVTGRLDEEQRSRRVSRLASTEKKVLVATDCLSEGINLQDGFDSVIHYDLPWNPMRLRQRDGRVDRFGQKSPVVRSVLLHGANNAIDLLVMNTLARKYRQIQRDLGLSVPMPEEAGHLVETLIESVVASGSSDVAIQTRFAIQDASVSRIHQQIDNAARIQAGRRSQYVGGGLEPPELQAIVNAGTKIERSEDSVTAFLRLSGHLDVDDTSMRPAGAMVDTQYVEELALRVLDESSSPHDDAGFTNAGAGYSSEIIEKTFIAIGKLRFSVNTPSVQTYSEEPFCMSISADTTTEGESKDDVETLLVFLERSAPLAPIEAAREVDNAKRSLDQIKETITRRADSQARVLTDQYRSLDPRNSSEITAMCRGVDVSGLYVLLPRKEKR